MTRTLALAALLGGATLITACERKGYDINTDDVDDGNDAGDGADGTDPDVDGDGDGYTPLEGDCDDTDASINPDATEVCDGADNDCDGVTDEQDAADVTTWYFDGDGDGYGDPDASAVACDPITNHVDQAGDCDDDRDTVYPGAEEVCDDRDNDCDGETDEGDIASAPTWYYDGDSDGYGTPDDTFVGCDAPTDYVDNGEDCNDEDGTINPAAPDGSIDGVDDNCDGTPDDEASCNPYRPFGVTTGVRTYSTDALDGNSYTETVLIRSWDPAAGVAILERQLGGSIVVQETHQCDGTAVKMGGWIYQDGATGQTASFTFSSPRTDLDSLSALGTGARWSYAYSASDASTGIGWSASGTMEVAGFESVTVTAGTFDAMLVENTYNLIDSSGTVGSRTGIVQTWWVEGLGPVKVLDTSGGTVNETRELTSYTDFNP